MKIVLHIERLVLEGLAAETNARQLGAAVEQELSRLLMARRREGWRNGAVDAVSAPGGFTVADRPAQIALGIARAASIGIGTAQAGDVVTAFPRPGEKAP